VADPYGDLTSVTSWASGGQPAVVERTSGSGDTEVYEEFESTYLSSGPNSGLLESVLQQTKVGSGSWATIAETSYTYGGRAATKEEKRVHWTKLIVLEVDWSVSA
jgi:hypothetical protein